MLAQLAQAAFQVGSRAFPGTHTFPCTGMDSLAGSQAHVFLQASQWSYDRYVQTLGFFAHQDLLGHTIMKFACICISPSPLLIARSGTYRVRAFEILNQTEYSSCLLWLLEIPSAWVVWVARCQGRVGCSCGCVRRCSCCGRVCKRQHGRVHRESGKPWDFAKPYFQRPPG